MPKIEKLSKNIRMQPNEVVAAFQATKQEDIHRAILYLQNLVLSHKKNENENYVAINEILP